MLLRNCHAALAVNGQGGLALLAVPIELNNAPTIRRYFHLARRIPGRADVCLKQAMKMALLVARWRKMIGQLNAQRRGLFFHRVVPFPIVLGHPWENSKLPPWAIDYLLATAKAPAFRSSLDPLPIWRTWVPKVDQAVNPLEKSSLADVSSSHFGSSTCKLRPSPVWTHSE